MRRAVNLLVMVWAVGAVAAPRTVLVAAGDCRDGALLAGIKDLRDATARTLGGDLIEGEVVLDIVRPRAPRSLQDIERQVESARALLYGGQDARGLEVIERALVDLERVSPTASPWPLTQTALVLQALMFKNLERPKEMTESFRRILRVAPAFRLDPDAHPPSAIAALEALRKELARGRKQALSVRVESGLAATVFVDGAPMGTTPLRLELAPGAYRVALVIGEAASFPRRVDLSKEVTLTVDLAFEAAVALSPPLCLHDVDDGAALKLAQLATADRVIVLRNGATRGNPPYLEGALYEVATGRQARAGAVQPELLPNLATFLITGQEQRGVEKPDAAVLQVAGVESPALPKGRASSQPGARAVPEVAPALPATFDERRGASPGKVWSGVLLGAGVLAGVTGVVLYATGAPARTRLAGLTDSAGQLPTAGTTAHREALQLVGQVNTTRAASFTLVGVAVGAVVGGALGLVLFPSGEVTVSGVATHEGAAVSLGGAF